MSRPSCVKQPDSANSCHFTVSGSICRASANTIAAPPNKSWWSCSAVSNSICAFAGSFGVNPFSSHLVVVGSDWLTLHVSHSTAATTNVVVVVVVVVDVVVVGFDVVVGVVSFSVVVVASSVVDVVTTTSSTESMVETTSSTSSTSLSSNQSTAETPDQLAAMIAMTNASAAEPLIFRRFLASQKTKARITRIQNNHLTQIQTLKSNASQMATANGMRNTFFLVMSSSATSTTTTEMKNQSDQFKLDHLLFFWWWAYSVFSPNVLEFGADALAQRGLGCGRARRGRCRLCRNDRGGVSGCWCWARRCRGCGSGLVGRRLLDDHHGDGVRLSRQRWRRGCGGPQLSHSAEHFFVPCLLLLHLPPLVLLLLHDGRGGEHDALLLLVQFTKHLSALLAGLLHSLAFFAQLACNRRDPGLWGCHGTNSPSLV